MSELTFPFWTVFQILENRLSVAEALGFSEISRLGANRERLLHVLRENVRRLVEADALPQLHGRHRAVAPAAVHFIVNVEPAAGTSSWREPLALRFDGLSWRHGKDAVIVFLPMLGIEVLAARSEDLDIVVDTEIRAALARSQALTLPRLVMLQRVAHLHVEQSSTQVKVQSPKARALAAELGQESKPSVLRQIGTDLRKEAPEPYFAFGNVLALLGEMLGAAPPRSVLLVGPAGVGKTAAVRELVRRRGAQQLKKTPFWATSGARLVAGMSGYGMWQERCQQLVREASRRRAILHLGNLVELTNVGKSEHNAMGIASFLRPYLARGELLAIAECTPEQIPVLEREDPHLLDVFQQLMVSEPNAEQGREILRHWALQAPLEMRKPLLVETLDTLDRLHRRFATYSAYPGRPLRFLHNLLHDYQSATEIRPAEVISAFTRETGLPRVLLDPEQALDLAETRCWFEERILGQPEAVELIVDLLATVKASLTRPGKPIAGLLFIGPTGVGKTEMAKALAEFLFGSRQRLTRLDMSEFSDAVAVQRLVGLSGDEGLLTAKVREQPFSVLLLDEFEKAHPLFLDMLLQILGDGRLTDAAGRLANFCNTVVILTSNLGSESYQQGALGFSGGAVQELAQAQRESARAHFEREVQAYVRPELFNRIDRIVPFAPLDGEQIAGIARRHLKRLESRDGIRCRGVNLRIDETVAAHLARNGFDARYGARPLLRTVEREMLAPLADQMNRYSGGQALEVDVSLGAAALEIRVKASADARDRDFAGEDSAFTLKAAEECVQLRRQLQALEHCASVRELQNELFQLEKEQTRLQQRAARQAARLAQASEEARQRLTAKLPRLPAQNPHRLARLARLRQTAERLRELGSRYATLENDALQALYVSEFKSLSAPTADTVALLRTEWQALLLILYCRGFPKADRVTLALFSETSVRMLELAEAYLRLARSLNLRAGMTVYQLPPPAKIGRKNADKEQPPAATDKSNGAESFPSQFWRDDWLIRAASRQQPEQAVLRRAPIKDPEAWVEAPPSHVLGLALEFHGPAAAPRLAREAGLHVFRASRQLPAGVCLVETSEARLNDYMPPPGIARRGAIGSQPRRRVYDRNAQTIEDDILRTKAPWQHGALVTVLTELVEKRLERDMLALLEE